MIPRRWKGVALFAGGTLVAGVLMYFHPQPLVVNLVGWPTLIAMAIGKLWMSEYAYGKSDQ